MTNLTLVFSDGERAMIDAGVGEAILTAARRHGFDLAYGCEMGGCQTCQGELEAGRVAYDESVSPALTEAEMAAGAVLCCVGVPTADTVVRLPYTRASLLPQRAWSLRLTDVTRVADTTVLVRGRMTGSAPFAFYPGQYVNIRVPGTDQYRSYSMATAPEEAGEGVEFYVRLLAGGAMSDYLTERARIGDELEARGPMGIFYLREGNSPICMIAGGTGIAPMMSMLRSMACRERRHRRITVCFGVNTVQDLFAVDELAALAARFDRLEVRTAVVRPDPSWTGPVGVATDLLEGVEPPGEAYLCGPPAMVTAAQARLQALGFEASAIRHEPFVPSGTAAA